MNLDRKTLKKLWNGETVLCPKCSKEYLIPLHRNKKESNDWQCPNCKEVIRTINILNNMLKDGK